MKKMISPVRLLILLAVLIASLLSCSIDNTMYNARKLYNSARNRPLNPNGFPTPQAVDEYTKTIKKCGYILTERKNSAQADDALLLLAKSLYYKGNSHYQAKDQFVSFLKNFPNSPYAPEAVLYLAQSYRMLNQPVEAENTLATYIRDPLSAEHHPRALLLLADFALQDKDYSKAQFWLEQILSQYAKTTASKEAGFLLGKNYFSQKKYDKSLEQFQKVSSDSKVSKQVRLDARFFVALNLLMLGESQKSLNAAKKLLKDEYRPEKMPGVRMLYSRILMSLNNDDEAISLFQSIISSNARTLSSAEAYFHLGEYYYYKKSDVQNAMDSFNKVKTESSISDFADESSLKYNALNTIYKSNPVILEQNPKGYLERNLENADKFYTVLTLPDSAYAIYDRLISTPSQVRMEMDSLDYKSLSIQARLDSLSAAIDTLQLSIVSNKDSLQTESNPPLSAIIPALPDSLTPDSVGYVPTQPDLKATKLLLITNLQKDKRDLQTELSDLNKKRETLQTIYDDFNNEYSPFIMFSKAAVIYRAEADTTKLKNIYEDLASAYPNNKYTLALKLLLEGKPVKLIDPVLEQQEKEMDKALTDMEVTPDSALVVLERLADSPYKEIKLQANYRLGWHYLFEQRDTLKAKLYFNETVKTDRANPYTQTILRFYNGKIFTIDLNSPDSLASTTTLPDSLQNLRGNEDTLIPIENNTNQSKTDQDESDLTQPQGSEAIKPD